MFGSLIIAKMEEISKLFRNYGVDKSLRPVAVQKHEVNPRIPGWLNLYILGWRIYNKRIHRVEIVFIKQGENINLSFQK